MSETTESLRHKLEEAGELDAVVRTMKVLAASNIGQYENAVKALGDYYYTVELGLNVCLKKQVTHNAFTTPSKKEKQCDILVFGSDQGLIGQFNDRLCEFVIDHLKTINDELRIWAVGERIHSRLTDQGYEVESMYSVPNSVKAITPLVTNILLKNETTPLYIFHNKPEGGAAYQPEVQQLLPLDKKWTESFVEQKWPGKTIPEILGNSQATLKSLIYEYLFVSIFKACAESLASENASRLAAMQRAEKNITDMLSDLNQSFHRLRQNAIDEELFDVISGFEALKTKLR